MNQNLYKMKKTILFRYALLLGIFVSFAFARAQNQDQIFYEDFEGALFPPKDWVAIQDTQELVYLHWYAFEDDKGVSTLAGRRSAYIDTKIYDTPTDHAEPAKHEWLITPEIALPSDRYTLLSFLWQAQKIQALDKKVYNTWVLVSTNNGVSWDTIWSLTDEAAMVNSGVSFPWENFGRYKSELDLTKYKGKSIKIAWYYHNFEFAKGDMFKFDNVTLSKYDPILNPIAQIDPTSFSFPNAYVGFTVSSGNAFNLTNIGKDTLRILSLEGLAGTDFECMINDFSKVELKKNETLKFSVQYTPSTAGAKNATLTIKTNGGDVQIALSGNKIMLPTDYTVESFEGETFPPVGWTSDGWRKLANGSSGYYGVGISFNKKGILCTPRLDLSQGSSTHYIGFDYIDYADSDDYGSYTDNVDEVQFSSDGGSTWQTIFTSTPSGLESWTRQKINLPNITSDNCFLRFVFTVSGELSFETIMSTWYLDNVVLPPIYGKNLPPQVATKPIPADSAKNQYTNNLKLSWLEVLHATQYRVKIGTTNANLGNILDSTVSINSLIISNLANNTPYYWSVTPMSSAGSASNPSIWMFTTIADQTISDFPYTSDFEDAVSPPLGWRTEATTDGPKWSRTDVFPYEGKWSVICGSQEGQSYFAMPPLQLPADKEMQISFMWGNDAPAGLKKNLAPPANVGEKYIGADTLFFEVSTNEINWKPLLFLSESNRDTMYWRRGKVVLSEYAGKTVYLRWSYNSVNYMRSTGGALDNVIVEEYMKDGKAVFNQIEWNAGVVNAKTSVDSKNTLTLSNDGEATLVVENVSFTNTNFSSDLQIGTSIVKNATKPFTITFVANPAGDISDSMKVVFANGLIAYFPVKGNALPENTRCYTFDQDEAFATSLPNFTMLDVDGKSTCSPVMINYPKIGTPFAYIVMNWKLADWRNIYPTSGDQCLAALSSADWASSVEDWLISDKFTATATSKVRFFAKSYGPPEDFTLHKITVLVSETDNNKANFKVVPNAENLVIPYDNDGKFTEFTVDLSAYDGKPVHIALRHTADKDGFVMFLDDLWFENFQFAATDNQAPRFTTQAPTSANVNEAFSYTFRVVDVDGDPLQFDVVGLPSWLSVTYAADGGTISGTPSVTGNVFFKITATDGQLTTAQEVLFAVHSSDNTAPSFTSIPPTEANVDRVFTYEFKASDPEGDALHFDVIDLPLWASVTYNRTDGGTITGTPTLAGDVSFKITVNDGMLADTQNVALKIGSIGNEQEENFTFNCYPNPAQNTLNIQTSETNYDVSLISLSGIVVYNAKNVKTIDISSYPNGLYFVRFANNHTIKTLRIIKQ